MSVTVRSRASPDSLVDSWHSNLLHHNLRLQHLHRLDTVIELRSRRIRVFHSLRCIRCELVVQIRNRFLRLCLKVCLVSLASAQKRKSRAS